MSVDIRFYAWEGSLIFEPIARNAGIPEGKPVVIAVQEEVSKVAYGASVEQALDALRLKLIEAAELRQKEAENLRNFAEEISDRIRVNADVAQRTEPPPSKR